MKAMTLPEVGPVKQAISFLMHFITQSRNHQHMTSAVLKKGEEVIQTVLLCIGIYTLRNNVELFADIFVAFNKKYPAELVTWMKVLEVPNYPTACVTPPQKETFMKSIIKYVLIAQTVSYSKPNLLIELCCLQGKSQQTLSSGNYS